MLLLQLNINKTMSGAEEHWPELWGGLIIIISLSKFLGEVLLYLI